MALACINLSGRYRKLKVLHLAFNKLRGIPSGYVMIVGFSYMYKCKINVCVVCHFHVIRFFTHMRELEYINLSGNSISSLPAILGCPKIQFLLLHSNQLPSLPPLPTLPYLNTLDLSCNQFEALPELSSFPHLQFLDLSGNSSLSISKETAKKLRYVDDTRSYILAMLVYCKYNF